MYCRGVRGATVADDNTASSILAATGVLLERLVEANDIEHFQVVACSEVLQGLKKTKEIMPDLILSDVMMPKMDGFEL